MKVQPLNYRELLRLEQLLDRFGAVEPEIKTAQRDIVLRVSQWVFHAQIREKDAEAVRRGKK